MNPVLLEGFADVATNFFPPRPPVPIPLSPEIILIGIGLIIITIIIILFLKRVIMNSIVGLILWFLAVIVFKVNLPFLPSLVISLIFGAAGIGAMILLAAFGVLK